MEHGPESPRCPLATCLTSSHPVCHQITETDLSRPEVTRMHVVALFCWFCTTTTIASPLLHEPPPRRAAARRPTPPETARRPRLMVLLYAMPGGLGLGRALGSGRASAGKRSQPAQSAVRAASCRGLQPNFPLGARARARYGPRQPLPDPARSTADRELFSPMRSAATMAQMWCSIYL